MKPAFKIGDWVKSSTCVHFFQEYVDKDVRGYNRTERHRKMDKLERDIIGQIVGGAWRQLGEVREGGGSLEDGPDPPYLEIKELIYVFLVREGFNNKPVEVLPDDLTPAEPLKHGLPMLKARRTPADERYRQMCRETAADMPRVKGRFAKVYK